jgi:hypothetical protein
LLTWQVAIFGVQGPAKQGEAYFMSLSEKHIEEFRQIYKEHFHKEISKEDAYKNGLKLLRLIEILYKPIDDDFVNEDTENEQQKSENFSKHPP